MSPRGRSGPPAAPPGDALAALPARLGITHPERVYWPDDGWTKLDLLRHDALVWPRLEPFLRDRLLSLERCPDGVGSPCFYQKERPAGLPPDTPTREIEHESSRIRYVVGGRLETQLALAGMGCLAIHVWGSRAAHPRKPDWVCFDLDPASGGFADAARAALRVKDALDALELRSFAKTSGGRGMHVFVPIEIGPDADEVKDFALGLSRHLARAYRDELTVEARIAARGERLYLDCMRNGFAQTVVAPWSPRARPKAPVSTPLEWSEVRPDLDPTSFNLGTIGERLAMPDPWADFFEVRQPLDDAIRAVAALR
ncbi:non-homologous end-joining DNA ligase [bacterium]|nr:non-homologous end-joining DNA ligase [bacterium]